MMRTAIGRTEHASRSTERYRIAAGHLHAYLGNIARVGTLEEVVLRSTLGPFGAQSLRLLKDLPQGSINGEWLQFGERGRGRRIVWNVFRGISPGQWRAFCRLLDSDAAAKGFLTQAVPDFDFGRRASGCGVLMDVLEATLCVRCPQAVAAYANSASGFASPESIDLAGASGSIGREDSRRQLPGRYPVFLSRLRTARKLRTGGIDLLASIHKVPGSSCTPIDATAVAAFQHALRKTDIERTSRRFNSFLRSAQEIPWLVDAIFGASFLKQCDAHTHEAARMIEAWNPEYHDRIEAILRESEWRQSTTWINLFGYDAVMARFELSAPYPDLANECRAALRVILILLSVGRRLGCLSAVRLDNFVDEGGALDLLVEKTKVPAMNNTYLPLDILLGGLDAAFLRRWLAVTVEKHDGGKYLFELAGIGMPSDLGFDHATADRRFAERAHAFLGTPRRLRLHDLRRMAITWLAVRLRLCEEPWLARHALLTSSCQHPVFSADSLQRLRDGVLSGAGTDHVKIIAIIAGHKTRYTARMRYNFAFPILSAIETAATWRREREDIDDSLLRARLDELTGYLAFAPI